MEREKQTRVLNATALNARHETNNRVGETRELRVNAGVFMRMRITVAPRAVLFDDGVDRNRGGGSPTSTGGSGDSAVPSLAPQSCSPGPSGLV